MAGEGVEVTAEGADVHREMRHALRSVHHDDRTDPMSLHHKVREFDTQKKVFEQLTVASTVLSDPQTAFQEIDRVLHAALRYKRPVYIELPRDMVSVVPDAPYVPSSHRATSDADANALPWVDAAGRRSERLELFKGLLTGMAVMQRTADGRAEGVFEARVARTAEGAGGRLAAHAQGRHRHGAEDTP